MERWHLPSIEASGKREPRVLFSGAEGRAVLIDLNAGEEMGDHRLHEHSVLQVISGRLELNGVECDAGTLATFPPGETRNARALEATRLLLLLTPWPGANHYHEGEDADPSRMPASAVPPTGS